MVGISRALRIAAGALVVTGGLLVASCGGGTVDTTPLVQPTTAPAAANVPATIPAAGGTTRFAATSNGQYATFTNLAYPGSAVTITATASTTAPSNAPSLSSVLRRKTESLAGAVPFYWLTFSVSASFSTQYASSFGVSLASNDPATGQYYIEFDDVTSSPATKLGDAGPGTVANGFVTLSTGGGSSQTLLAGHTYLAQFFYFPAGTPIPTPSGSGSPTSSPSGSASPTASPSGSASPTASPSGSASPTGSASSSPSPSSTGTNPPQTQYTFLSAVTTWAVTGGPSGSGSSTIPVESGNGISLTSTWGANNATTSISFAGQLAGDNGDIATSPAFPGFTSTPVYDTNGNLLVNNGGYTPLTYLKVSATPDTTFTQTPAITINVSPPAYTTGETTCSLFSLNQSGTPGWNQTPVSSTSVTATTVTFAATTLSAGNTVDIGTASNNNVGYIAFACK